MSFKENLLKKIQIQNLTRKVLASIGPTGSEDRLDKEAMRNLLAMSPYELKQERDLDLYVKDIDGGTQILVLDNELPIYRTTIEDVVMRKSPYIKEMVNIRNIIKILKDADVKISRKEDTVQSVRQDCLELLDLTYTRSDVEDIVYDGIASVESNYSEGIKESLLLLGELSGYRSPPKAFRIRHHEILGAMTAKAAGEFLYGPIVLFNQIDNSLKLIETPISSFDKDKLEYFRQVAAGNKKADVEGKDIFNFFKDAVPETKT